MTNLYQLRDETSTAYIAAGETDDVCGLFNVSGGLNILKNYHLMSEKSAAKVSYITDKLTSYRAAKGYRVSIIAKTSRRTIERVVAGARRY